jgi:hypothetical protein
LPPYLDGSSNTKLYCNLQELEADSIFSPVWPSILGKQPSVIHHILPSICLSFSSSSSSPFEYLCLSPTENGVLCQLLGHTRLQQAWRPCLLLYGFWCSHTPLPRWCVIFNCRL